MAVAAPCDAKLAWSRRRFSRLLPLLSQPALTTHLAVPSADSSAELLLLGACKRPRRTTARGAPGTVNLVRQSGYGKREQGETEDGTKREIEK